MSIKEGQKAPDFTLMDDAGKRTSLSDFKGKSVILYFYPKDDTPGCTLQACNFRDDQASFSGHEVIILGVSPDSPESHKKFKAKFSLNFPLLCDMERVVVKAYDVWKEKSMYGRKYWGVERTTFLIDGAGKIKKIFPKVKVPGHNQEILAALTT